MTSNTFYVVTAADSGFGSITDAVEKANKLPTATIFIEKSVGSSITLNSELIIRSDIKLINNTADDLTIQTNSSRVFAVRSRLFDLDSRCNKHLTLTGGHHLGNGGAILVNNPNNQLILQRVRIINNFTAGSGGAIYSAGKVILIASLIADNQAGVQGGGIFAAKDLTATDSSIIGNQVVIPAASNGGGGIFVDNGNCTLDHTIVNRNTVSSIAGSGGGIIVMTGSINVQNDSHVDHNTAFNAGGIQEGVGDVIITGASSVDHNESFNSATGSAGGGGVTITLGTVYVNNSSVSHNKTVGMYSGGIVSLIGNVSIVGGSTIKGNSNRGPGGGLATNIGSVVIAHSVVAENTGASLGGAIVNFTPHPGYISVTNSEITGNTLTNAQTIRGTIRAFLEVILGNLADTKSQAAISGSGGSSFIQRLPEIIEQLRSIHSKLQALPALRQETIGGGAIAALLTTSVIIAGSNISGNYIGKNVSAENTPFISKGAAVLAFNAELSISKSTMKKNKSADDAYSVWSNGRLDISESTIRKSVGGVHTGAKSVANITNSTIKRNKTKNGAGIDNEGDLTIISSQIKRNKAKRQGGGIHNTGDLTVITSTITRNKAKRGGGIYSTKPLVRVDSVVANNKPDDIVIDSN